MGNALEGRTALVTGASRGIGRAIAIALAAEGARVAVNYRTGADEASAVVAQIESRGGIARAFAADVSKPGDVERLLASVQTAFGDIDILVNNAGIALRRSLDELAVDDWKQTLDVNLSSVFLVTDAVLPSMRKHRFGRIINLSSVAAHTGGIIGPHYAASKGGILGLTHGYASRVAREGVTVNAIAPALIATDMIEGVDESLTAHIPVGRFGTPEEVASVAVMLASNAYITGQTINVDGGMYMT